MGLVSNKVTGCRPRILTVIAFCMATAIIVLANLSFDEQDPGEVVHCRSYGWPMIWHRLVLYGFNMVGGERAVGWYFSPTRLAANLALWLAVLAALTVACEWLLRRCRPRPHWSLRTLLVFVAVVAMGCGWYAKARNRAALQDPLIGLRGGYGVPLVFVKRCGPKWLDLFGLDPLRRRIVLASNWQLRSTEPDDARRFLQLSRLSDVQHVSDCSVDELTPATAKALGGMRQLQTLTISFDRLNSSVPAALSDLRELRSLSIKQRLTTAGEEYARLSDECLAAIGNMPHLETLSLSKLPLRGKSLACLSALTNLKSLSIDFWNGEWNGSALGEPVSEDCLRAIGMLSQLEWLRLERLQIDNESLAYLAGLTELKTLCLNWLITHDLPRLSHFPALGRLEALDLTDSKVDENDLRTLAALPRLKSISLDVDRFFTLRDLATLESLEEVSLEHESPEKIEELHAVKRLQRLYLGDPWRAAGQEGTLTLDDGQELHVHRIERFRHALERLRQARPGITIKTDRPAVYDMRWGGILVDADFYFGAAPERPAEWLPGLNTVWMTPKELTDFEESGGHADFYGGTWSKSDDGSVASVEFDAPRGKN